MSQIRHRLHDVTKQKTVIFIFVDLKPEISLFISILNIFKSVPTIWEAGRIPELIWAQRQKKNILLMVIDYRSFVP